MVNNGIFHLMITQHQISVENVNFGNELPLTLIAGPCQLESRSHAMMMAEQISDISAKLNIGFVFKTSFDKANRTSAKSARGIGLESAVEIFHEIKSQFGCPILTDIHDISHPSKLGDAVDIIQIPAFLCRQTDLLQAAAASGKIVNVKKGQFLAPWDAKNIVEKLNYFGTNKILLTERGVSFGYNTLISDMRSLPIMAQTGYPVIFDATHSVQQPGGLGMASGGQREFVPILARAATAVGIAAIFIETHNDPDNAPSDGPCMLPLSGLEELMKHLMEIDRITKTYNTSS